MRNPNKRNFWKKLPQVVAAASCLLLSACSGLIVLDHPPAGEVHRPAGAAVLGIPPGHLPPPGECRLWFPGKPPGHQPPPQRCGVLSHEVPIGAWLLFRPPEHPEHVKVSAYHVERPGIVMRVRLYETATGRFLHEE